MNNTDKYFEIGQSIVDKAGKYLLKNFNKPHKVTHKTDYHFGIKEDLELNDIYTNYFKKYTPEVSLYTEEGEKNLENDLVWVVDPIEGTSNYRVGIPFYATQICLLKNKVPIFSFVFAPSLKELFYAKKGNGAYLNEKKIIVSDVKDLNMTLISVGKGTKQDDLLWYGGIMKSVMENVRTFRHFGACGLELAYTANGKIDIYINKGSHNIYDYAPGSLLVREASGVVKDFAGHNWNINESSLVASNKLLATNIINLLKVN